MGLSRVTLDKDGDTVRTSHSNPDGSNQVTFQNGQQCMIPGDLVASVQAGSFRDGNGEFGNIVDVSPDDCLAPSHVESAPPSAGKGSPEIG